MTLPVRPVRVTAADEAAARDADAIAAGRDGWSLMLAAGTVAAADVVRDAGHRVARGVEVWCGGGNNGGDGYVVAAQLVRLGVRVRVIRVAPPRTGDARRAALLAARAGVPVCDADAPPDGAAATGPGAAGDPAAGDGPGVVVDALLGTGARGPLREALARAAAHLAAARARGAHVIALDVPTGVDATTGERSAGHVTAHTTVTFGTLKRGLLTARDACGRIVVADIGLGEHAERPDAAALLADADVLRDAVPVVPWDAHKGTRGRVLVIGGAAGMAGAVQFVARGALASGAGLVRVLVHPDSASALQAAVPAVVCLPWPDDAPRDDALRDDALRDDALRDDARRDDARHDDARRDDALRDAVAWSHAVVLGPGLGRDAPARAQLRAVLDALHGAAAARRPGSSRPPVLVLDADALRLVRDPPLWARLREVAAQGDVVLTPHAGEFAALDPRGDAPPATGAADLGARLTGARALAAASGCHVLLKGAPTCCVSPAGTAWVVPRGSAALATGGTGDVLAGVIAAVVAPARAVDAEDEAADEAADEDVGRPSRSRAPVARAAGHACLRRVAAAAWVHGVAGEIAAGDGPAARGSAAPERPGDGRGVTVDTVIAALSPAWARFGASGTGSPSSRPPGVLATLPAVPVAPW